MTKAPPLSLAVLALAASLAAARADDAIAPPAPAAHGHVYLIGTLRITQPYLDPAIARPPNLTREMRNGAAHLAWSGLGPLTAGSAPITAVLHFERAGNLRVSFTAADGATAEPAVAAPAAPDKPVDLAQ